MEQRGIIRCSVKKHQTDKFPIRSQPPPERENTKIRMKLKTVETTTNIIELMSERVFPKPMAFRKLFKYCGVPNANI